jgi:regulator of sigma E protease
VEAVRRKPVAPEKEGFIHWLGFLFLMLLIVLVTFNDIMRFFRG